MSEQSRAILGTVSIVACLALLGFMVYMKTEGAVVAAIAAVTTIVAFFTRPPDRKDPGPSVVVGLAIGTILVATGCTPNARWAAADLVMREVTCTLDETAKGAPIETAIVNCGVTDETRKDVLAIISKSQSVAARMTCGDAGAR